MTNQGIRRKPRAFRVSGLGRRIKVLEIREVI